MCKQIAMRWLFCNKVNTFITVDLLVKNDWYKKKGSDRDIGENEENEKGSERCSSKENIYLFSTALTKDLDLFMLWSCYGHMDIGLSMFQNLLWVYGMAWMSVRFPGLKFCPSPPLLRAINFNIY